MWCDGKIGSFNKLQLGKKTFVSFLPVSDFRMLTLTGRDNVDSGVAKDLSTKATVVTVFFI